MCESSHQPALQLSSIFHSQRLISHFPLLKTRPSCQFSSFSAFPKTLYTADHSDHSSHLSISHFEPVSSFPAELHLAASLPLSELHAEAPVESNTPFQNRSPPRGQLQPTSYLQWGLHFQVPIWCLHLDIPLAWTAPSPSKPLQLLHFFLNTCNSSSCPSFFKKLTSLLSLNFISQSHNFRPWHIFSQPQLAPWKQPLRFSHQNAAQAGQKTAGSTPN